MTAPRQTPTRPPRPEQRNASVIDLAGRTHHESSPPSGFAAQIEGATMADLIQLECTRGLTRAVRVMAGKNSGFLYFDQGQLVHAIAGNKVGEAAAREILTWEGGTVRPSDSYWVKPPTIEISWQALLISAAHAVDESARAESGISLKLDIHEPEKGPEMKSVDQEEGITRLVELTASGEVLRSQGDAGDFSDAAAYCAQLARLIGEGLGLEEFSGLECSSEGKTMLVYETASSIVALEGDPHASAVLTHRKKAGL